MSIVMADVFADDPTMRKRADFETELLCLIAELRQSPPVRRAQLKADSESLFKKWLELTQQEADNVEINERIKASVQARSFNYEKWQPSGVKNG